MEGKVTSSICITSDHWVGETVPTPGEEPTGAPPVRVAGGMLRSLRAPGDEKNYSRSAQASAPSGKQGLGTAAQPAATGGKTPEPSAVHAEMRSPRVHWLFREQLQARGIGRAKPRARFSSASSAMSVAVRAGGAAAASTPTRLRLCLV